jgi:hypothetical protein
MPHQTKLAIPQPCSESWDAMTPATAGRHCAACQKTVVDFTLKTDAEILAYLAKAAAGRTCGRFAAGQLERPLQRAVLAAPTARWRTWLAAVAAVWGLREAAGPATKAQVATEWRARYWGGPAPAVSPVVVPATQPAQPAPAGRIMIGMLPAVSSAPAQLPLLAPVTVLRGVVTDAASGEGLPGASVLLTNTNVGVATGADGTFELPLPPTMVGAPAISLSIRYIGYVGQEHTLAAREAAATQRFPLKADTRMMGEVVIVPYASKLPPAPWHPRRFYHWGKYWVTRPFRRW